MKCLILALSLVGLVACANAPTSPSVNPAATVPQALADTALSVAPLSRPTDCSTRYPGNCPPQYLYDKCLADTLATVCPSGCTGTQVLTTQVQCRAYVRSFPNVPDDWEPTPGIDVQSVGRVLKPADSCFPYACDEYQQ